MLHADVANVEFLGKSAAEPKYCLVIVDLFTMKNRKLMALKLEKFYKDVEYKRKNKKTRLQTDLEFKQKKIFDLNKKYNIEMFSTAVRGGKAFATEQKIRELKKIIFGLLTLGQKAEKKITQRNNSESNGQYQLYCHTQIWHPARNCRKKIPFLNLYKEWFDIR